MSLKEKLAKGRLLYKTGIKAIDREITGGFPRNSFGVIRGPGGGGKSVLLNEMVLSQMNAGKRVIFVCFEDTPVSVLQNLISLGWDYEKNLDSGMIQLVDCFSEQILRRISKYEHTTLVSNPSEPEEISDAISGLIEDNDSSKIGGVYIDSITELFLQSHPFKAVNAVKAWRATFCKDDLIPFWATYHTGLQQFAAYDDMITYSSDSIIDTRHEPVFASAGILIKQFRITKVKGAKHNPVWVTFDVGPKGIKKVTFAELRKIASKITKYEAPRSEEDT
ncbi:MAG: RAD55 family ATPase [Candidatus Thorarchaeota archaeon]